MRISLSPGESSRFVRGSDQLDDAFHHFGSKKGGVKNQLFAQNVCHNIATKSGYKKMNIPTELYQLILQILKQNSTKYIDEGLNDHHFLSNWQRIYPDGSKGDESCKNPCYNFTK